MQMVCHTVGSGIRARGTERYDAPFYIGIFLFFKFKSMVVFVLGCSVL